VGRLRLLVAALCALVCALALAGPAAAFSRADLALPMDDGVSLAATLYLPDGTPPDGGWPAIVMFHGLGGNRTSSNTIAESSFANQGYAVLTFDTRGHGQSGGLFSAVGERELQDFRALHSWLAARPDVKDDAIGAWGISLGGGAVWRSLVAGIPFAAAAVTETWVDLYEALVPQNLSKSGAIFAFLNSVAADQTGPEVAAIRSDALASRNLPAIRAFAAPRSSRSSLAQIRTPVFVFQGRRDFAFGLEQGITAYRLLGGPKRLYIGNFGHAPSTFPGPDSAQVFAEASDWFARFLKGSPNGIDTRPPVELSQDPYRELAGASYAGLPPTSTVRFRISGRKRITANAALVRPLGRTTRLLETFGSPVLKLALSGTHPHVVAVLKAVKPDGSETIVSEGGAAVRLSSKPRTVTIRMISQATTIPRGSRLTLRIGATSGDLLYIAGVPSSSRLTVGGGTLAVPVLARPISG
jgi:predicted acyl esterase